MVDNTERLIEKYRVFEDQVLIDLRDNNELTDNAFLALNQVLSERGLEIKEPVAQDFDESPCDDLSYNNYADGADLVTVTKFATPTEAYVFQGCLESEGIAAFVADANLLQANAFLATAVGWVRVQVAESDLHRAKGVFNSFERGEYSIDDDGMPQNSNVEDDTIESCNPVERTESISECSISFLLKTGKLLIKLLAVCVIGSIIAKSLNYF